MKLALFTLPENRFALKMGRIERILAPADEIPVHSRVIHLARILGIPVPQAEIRVSSHHVQLAGHAVALAQSTPSGSVEAHS